MAPPYFVQALRGKSPGPPGSSLAGCYGLVRPVGRKRFFNAEYQCSRAQSPVLHLSCVANGQWPEAMGKKIQDYLLDKSQLTFYSVPMIGGTLTFSWTYPQMRTPAQPAEYPFLSTPATCASELSLTTRVFLAHSWGAL